MSTLDRYIAKSFYRGFTLVVLVLVTLFGFAAFVEELDHVGTGDYQLGDAIIYVLLTMPRRFFDLAPVSAMLGALFSLGSLAAESELIAMRSIGASVKSIALSSLKASIPVLLIMIVVAQWIGPKYEREARRLRATAIAKGEALETQDGFWLKDGNNFIRIGTLLGGDTPSDLIILEFSQTGRLNRHLTAKRAEISQAENWKLEEVQETKFNDMGSSHQTYATLQWNSGLQIAELSKIPLAPETLSPTDLIAEIQSRKKRGLATENHALALWYLASRPLAFLAMVLFAVPFVFSSLRDSSQGKRAVWGAILGVLAYLIDQISGFAGLILTIHPAWTAMAPPALIGVLAVILLLRTE